MTSQLPALQVLIPLLAAPLCVLLHRARLAWLIATAASLACTLIALSLLQQTAGGQIVSYAMGGWQPPWGIEYRIDTLNAFVLVIVSAISSLALPYAYRSIAREVHASKHYLLYAGWLVVLTGLLGMTITGDAFNVFVFLEIASLASCLIIALNRDRRALSAAFQYLLVGTVGASFILLGIGLLYQLTGTLNMADLAQRLPALGERRGIASAFAFIVIGLGIKAALFPLHSWLAGAYCFAPSAVAVFLAGTASKVAVYVLLRFTYSIYGHELAFAHLQLDSILLPLSLLGIVILSLTAITQDYFKRLLAFSSVAQIGYILLGIAINNQAAVTASVLHLFNHAIIKAALFMAAGAIFYRIGSRRIVELAGLGRCMPWTLAAFIVAGLSLIGVPLTAGFISKWYLVVGALERGWWPVAVVVLLGSLMAVAYIWKVVEVACFQPPSAACKQASEAPLSMLLPLYLLVAANIYFGLDTEFSLGNASAAAQLLLTGRF